MELGAIALNCTLKKTGGEGISTEAIITVLDKAFADRGVRLAETLRMADYTILSGVTSDEGPGDS